MKNIPTPKPTTYWKTSDDRVHATEELAHRHEVFLQVKTLLPGVPSDAAAYTIVTALAGHFDFVERT